jgi:hypothetical protein
LSHPRPFRQSFWRSQRRRAALESAKPTSSRPRRCRPYCTAGAAACERSEAGGKAWTWSAREEDAMPERQADAPSQASSAPAHRAEQRAATARRRSCQTLRRTARARGVERAATYDADNWSDIAERVGALRSARASHAAPRPKRDSDFENRCGNRARKDSNYAFSPTRGRAAALRAPPAACSCARPQLRASRAQQTRAIDLRQLRRTSR